TAWSNEYPDDYRSLTAGAGYERASGSDHRAAGFFVQASRFAYDFQGAREPRGLILAYRDQLGANTAVEYDGYALLVASITDPAGLQSSSAYDYRFLRPIEVVDPNGNRTRITYSSLGLVDSLFVMGKAEANEGDVQQPGSRFSYDFFAFS